MDYIGQCYAPDSVVFDDYGLQKGSKKIISDTYHTTAAFPDIVLDAEEVIWAGNDEIGFHTSHLIRIIGTNTGESRYGAAKGTRVHFLVIANCIALENDIFLEHVLYNTSAMLKQMGVDPWKEAERLALDPPPGWPRSEEVWNQLKNSASPNLPISEQDPVIGFDPDAFPVRSTIMFGTEMVLPSTLIIRMILFSKEPPIVGFPEKKRIQNTSGKSGRYFRI